MKTIWLFSLKHFDIIGKGDQRSRRGKIWRGTYGKTRPQTKKLATITAKFDKKNKAAK